MPRIPTHYPQKRVPTQNHHTEPIMVKKSFVCDYQSFVIPSDVILTVNLFLKNETHLPDFGRVSNNEMHLLLMDILTKLWYAITKKGAKNTYFL